MKKYLILMITIIMLLPINVSANGVENVSKSNLDNKGLGNTNLYSDTYDEEESYKIYFSISTDGKTYKSYTISDYNFTYDLSKLKDNSYLYFRFDKCVDSKNRVLDSSKIKIGLRVGQGCSKENEGYWIKGQAGYYLKDKETKIPVKLLKAGNSQYTIKNKHYSGDENYRCHNSAWILIYLDNGINEYGDNLGNIEFKTNKNIFFEPNDYSDGIKEGIYFDGSNYINLSKSSFSISGKKTDYWQWNICKYTIDKKGNIIPKKVYLETSEFVMTFDIVNKKYEGYYDALKLVNKEVNEYSNIKGILAKFKIGSTFKAKRNIANKRMKITLPTTSSYTSKAVKPKVVVKDAGITLKKDKDYTVQYKNNVKTGKATIIIKGKNYYTGTVKKYFYIVPKKVTISSVKPGKKQLTVKYKKVTGASGYQIAYSTSKSKGFKYITVNSKTASKLIKKLKSKKNYYVKVRAYKTVGKKKYYGTYSKLKSVKVK